MPKSNHASRPVLHAALMTADIAASTVAVMVSASSRDRRFCPVFTSLHDLTKPYIAGTLLVDYST